MQKKLTIAIDEQVYDGLYATIDEKRINQFIEKLIRSHVLNQDLESAYRSMASDEQREHQAIDWSKETIRDIDDGKG